MIPGRLFADPRALALLIALLAAVTVGTALVIEAAGYAPCELCLKERLPYYVGVPVALGTALASGRVRAAAAAGFVALILCFMVGAALGLYHTGVEMKFWAGPSECSGAVATAPDVTGFLKQLNSVVVVRCDEAAMHLFGLSLAGWNALVCVGLIGLANAGLLRSGSPLRGPLVAPRAPTVP